MADEGKDFHSDTEYSECIDYAEWSNFAASSDSDAVSYIINDKGVVKYILEDWKRSKLHDLILLTKKLDEGAVYVKIKVTKGRKCFPKGSNIYTVEFYTTYIAKF